MLTLNSLLYMPNDLYLYYIHNLFIVHKLICMTSSVSGIKINVIEKRLCVHMYLPFETKLTNKGICMINSLYNFRHDVE